MRSRATARTAAISPRSLSRRRLAWSSCTNLPSSRRTRNSAMLSRCADCASWAAARLAGDAAETLLPLLLVLVLVLLLLAGATAAADGSVGEGAADADRAATRDGRHTLCGVRHSPGRGTCTRRLAESCILQSRSGQWSEEGGARNPSPGLTAGSSERASRAGRHHAHSEHTCLADNARHRGNPSAIVLEAASHPDRSVRQGRVRQPVAPWRRPPPCARGSCAWTPVHWRSPAQQQQQQAPRAAAQPPWGAAPRSPPLSQGPEPASCSTGCRTCR